MFSFRLRKKVSIDSAATQIAAELVPRDIHRLNTSDPFHVLDQSGQRVLTTHQLREVLVFDMFAFLQGAKAAIAAVGADQRFIYYLMDAYDVELTKAEIFSMSGDFIKLCILRHPKYLEAILREDGVDPLRSLATLLIVACKLSNADILENMSITSRFVSLAEADKELMLQFFSRYKFA